MSTSTADQPVPYLDFVYLLRDYGIAAGMSEVLDFYRGMEKGLVNNLEELFIYGRLVFAKRPDQFDSYERAFCLYFYGIDLPRVAEGDPELFRTKQFKDWLQEAIDSGKIPRTALWNLSRDELMKMFWERIQEQMKAHHGGNKWVGTGGTSPFGHSGYSKGGFRVYGEPGNRSATKVIGDRRYISYDQENSLKGENIRQVLGSLKRMVPVGPEDELDLDETIYRTGRNGGEIELCFKRRELDRIKLVLLIDNGGYSMMPHINITRLLFSKVRDRFKDCEIFYFHNTIYRHVFRDSSRRIPFALEELLLYAPETRLFVVGDASMAPEELVGTHGSINFDHEDQVPSINRLKDLTNRFKCSVWLNPIPKESWGETYGAWTLNKIREVVHMEDLTLRGIKGAVEYIHRQN